MIFLFLFLSFFAQAQEPAAEDLKMVQMHYFRGFLVDAANNPEAGVKLLASVQHKLEGHGFNFKGTTSHWTSHQQVCEDLAKNPQSKVILVGHSYGASGAMLVANCLAEKNIPTEMLITISSFNAGAAVDVTKIPEHVKINYNFWVTDLAIPGYSQHLANNSSVTQVKNTKVKMYGPPIIGPHLHVPDKLIQLNTKLILKMIFGENNLISFPEVLSSDEPDKIAELMIF